MPITPASFLKASELKDKWGFNILVYGPSGVGKTVFGATAQDSDLGKEALVIDIECGSRSLIDRPDIRVIPIKNSGELRELHTYLAREPHPFRSLIFDSLTGLQEMLLEEIIGTKVAAGGIANIQDFGKVKTKICQIIKDFKSFATSRGWHVIFTALEDKEKEEGTGMMITSPALSNKTCQSACATVDAVGYLSSDSKGKRKMNFQGTSTLMAKLRQPMNKPPLPLLIEDPTMDKILRHLVGKQLLTPSTTPASPPSPVNAGPSGVTETSTGA